MKNAIDQSKQTITLVYLLFFLFLCTEVAFAQGPEVKAGEWPNLSNTTKPWTRWWWMGNAVDKKNLKHLLEEYKAAGLGGLEIAPIYGADFTPGFFEYFQEKRGYDLKRHLPDLLSEEPNEASVRLKSDYRETINEMLLEHFTEQWTNWAHSHGKKTKNQAHG